MDYREKIGKSRELELEGLEEAQAELTRELEACVERERSDEGDVGRFLPERLSVTASQGVPQASLEMYRWISLIYCHGDEDRERRYMVSLCQEDIDPGTNNLHMRQGYVQLWRGLRPGGEAAGHLNQRLDETDYGSVLLGTAIVFHPRFAYPIALREFVNKRGIHPEKYDGRCNMPAYDRHNPTSWPWGLGLFSWPDGKSPVLDLASPGYDAGHLARCVIALVKADIG